MLLIHPYLCGVIKVKQNTKLAFRTSFILKNSRTSKRKLVIYNLMEKTVGTHALRTVTIKHVTGKMDGVFGFVKMDFMVKCVNEVIFSLY